MLGIISKEEALDRAHNAGLDLVLVSNNDKNPVARIMDYGKFVFDQSKKRREAKKNQKQTDLKEVQLRPGTEEHDFNVKVKNAIRFLEHGDRVKVVLRFLGRERNFKEDGLAALQDFAVACQECGKVDRPPSMEGRSFMIMFLSPITPQTP